MTPVEQEIFAQISALRIAQRYMLGALLIALAEAKSLDLERALSFVDTLGAALRQPVGVTDPTARHAMALAADDIEALRPSIVKMTTLPPGAGRA